MKIFYITTTVHLSKNIDDGLGSTTHTYFVAKELVKLGHEVHVISKRYPGDPRNEVISGIQVHRLRRGIVSSGKVIEKSAVKKYLRPLKGILNIILAYQVNKLIDKYGCDVILERNHSLGVGAWTSYLTGCPLVLEVIDSILCKISVRRSQKIIAYTDRFFDKKEKKKVTIVKVGFDPATFYPKLEKAKYDVCYGGSFKPWDGVLDLIEAINLLVNKYKFKNLKVVMMGTGEVYERAVSLIQKYQLNKNIEMTGRVSLNEVRNFINQAKVCVAPYNIKKSDRGQFDKYGFYYAPLKVVEYMACGKPVVATKYVMIKNILPNGGGSFFTEGDVDGMAQSIKKLIQSDKLLAMGEKNLIHARNFTWQKVAADFDQVFKS
jgi:glycosyltransferase involved in cell wall biosynthesis